jgi:hypothetical protein
MAVQSKEELRCLNGLLPVSSVFLPLFLFLTSTSIYICFVHCFTICCLVDFLGIIIINNTRLTFISISILLTWPIQFNTLILTNESIPKSTNSCIDFLLHRILQFLFALIPPHTPLKLSFPKQLAVKQCLYSVPNSNGMNVSINIQLINFH